MAKDPLAKTLGPKAQKRAEEDAAKAGVKDPKAGNPSYSQIGGGGGRTRVRVPVQDKDGDTRNYDFDYDPATGDLRGAIK